MTLLQVMTSCFFLFTITPLSYNLFVQILIGGEMFTATQDSFEFVTPFPAPEPISTTTVIIIAVCGAIGLLFFVVIVTIVLCCCIQGYNKSSRKSNKGKECRDIPLNKVGHIDDHGSMFNIMCVHLLQVSPVSPAKASAGIGTDIKKPKILYVKVSIILSHPCSLAICPLSLFTFMILYV